MPACFSSVEVTYKVTPDTLTQTDNSIGPQAYPTATPKGHGGANNSFSPCKTNRNTQPAATIASPKIKPSNTKKNNSGPVVYKREKLKLRATLSPAIIDELLQEGRKRSEDLLLNGDSLPDSMAQTISSTPRANVTAPPVSFKTPQETINTSQTIASPSHSQRSKSKTKKKQREVVSFISSNLSGNKTGFRHQRTLLYYTLINSRC